MYLFRFLHLNIRSSDHFPFPGDENVELRWKSWLFGQLRPHWLCWRVAEFLMARYQDKLVKSENRHLLDKTISWQKIVSFFLEPHCWIDFSTREGLS